MDMTNTKNGLTEEQLVEIFDLMAWDPRIDSEVEYLYHYYGTVASRSVFQQDYIVFRLAAASTFEDKMEGKAIEVYYDLAIDELLVEGEISREIAKELSCIKVPERTWLSYPYEGGGGRSGLYQHEEYIICFSKKKDDKYMYEAYCQNSIGYCFEFSGVDLKELTCLGHKNGAEIRVSPILYGREVVDYLKKIIRDLCSNPIRRNNLAAYLQDILHITQYMAKLKRFSDEEEVRLIVFVPQKQIYAGNDIIRDVNEEHKYLFLKAPKDMCLGVSCAPFNNREETEEMMKFLNDNGYSVLD